MKVLTVRYYTPIGLPRYEFFRLHFPGSLLDLKEISCQAPGWFLFRHFFNL